MTWSDRYWTAGGRRDIRPRVETYRLAGLDEAVTLMTDRQARFQAVIEG